MSTSRREMDLSDRLAVLALEPRSDKGDDTRTSSSQDAHVDGHALEAEAKSADADRRDLLRTKAIEPFQPTSSNLEQLRLHLCDKFSAILRNESTPAQVSPLGKMLRILNAKPTLRDANDPQWIYDLLKHSTLQIDREYCHIVEYAIVYICAIILQHRLRLKDNSENKHERVTMGTSAVLRIGGVQNIVMLDMDEDSGPVLCEGDLLKISPIRTYATYNYPSSIIGTIAARWTVSPPQLDPYYAEWYEICVQKCLNDGVLQRTRQILKAKAQIELLGPNVVIDRNINAIIDLVLSSAQQTRSPFSKVMVDILTGSKLGGLSKIDLFSALRSELTNVNAATDLTGEQLDCADAASAASGGVLFIQGLSGTGKTFILSRLCSPFLISKTESLILAIAPDAMLLKVLTRSLSQRVSALKESGQMKSTKFIAGLFSNTTRAHPLLLAITNSDVDLPFISTKENLALQELDAASHLLGQLEHDEDRGHRHHFYDELLRKYDVSIGRRMLEIAGCVPDSPLANPDTNRFAVFRQLYYKDHTAGLSGRKEKTELVNLATELLLHTIQQASVLLCTTTQAGNNAVLNLITDRVSLIVMDEGSQEFEGNLWPLFNACFTRQPGLICTGDQFTPLSMSSSVSHKDSFGRVFQESFFTRMARLDMTTVHLGAQHRMTSTLADFCRFMSER